MTRRRYQPGVPTTLWSDITATATTFQIANATGWPTGAGDNFWVTIDAGNAKEERLLCTTVSGSSAPYTVSVLATPSYTAGRGKDGTSATSHAAGATAWPSWSATDADEANSHINASSGVHGLTGGVVGTTDTQTLTNKTLTSPKINDTVAITSTSTELNYVHGVTSAIQTQLDAKAAANAVVSSVNGSTGSITGVVTTSDSGTVTSTMIANDTIVNADINSAAAIDKTKISGTAITAADTGTVTSTMILNGTIVDADVNASAAIAQSKIAGMGAWTTTWTPTLTNFTAGTSPTTDYSYTQVGKTVFARFQLTAGTSPTSSGSFQISLPVTAATSAVNSAIGSGYVQDGGSFYLLQGTCSSTTAISLNLLPAGSTYVTLVNLSNTVPAASWWTSGDKIVFQMIYEAA